MAKTEDDFWNTSSYSGFNFDDEDDLLGVPSDNTVFSLFPELYSQVPIHALISKKNLDQVLDDIQSTQHKVAPSVEETIGKITSGHYVSLQAFIRFNDKMKLLDKAVETCDTNIIIKIILYIRGTLKTNIFYHQLTKRKAAVRHYGHYLLLRNQLDELADLYMATGNTSNMKYLYYLTGQGVVNKAVLHRKLEQFLMDHLQKLNSNDDRAELYDNLQLIKFQIDNNTHSNSVITQLVELCKNELSSHRGMEKINEFKKSFRIDDFTFDWTLLNVLASMQLWIHISDIFLKNNWLTKKNTLKTAIPPEVFLSGLSRHNPPKDVLETLLGHISDTDKAFMLANKLECHTFIIQYYINQRDRLALWKYKEKVAPQSTEYFLIESSLQSSEKKWKN